MTSKIVEVLHENSRLKTENEHLTAEVAALRATLQQPVEWLRNNYQDHANIASLCDAMKAAIEGECDGLAITDEQAESILAYVGRKEQP